MSDLNPMGKDRTVASLFEKHRPGTGSYFAGPEHTQGQEPAGALEGIPAHLLRKAAPTLPEMPEPEVVRHYTQLSSLNYSVDHGLYPLGSCSMKYNPKINEEAARLPGFARLHPQQPSADFPGALELIGHLTEAMCEIFGFDAFTLQPAAGAHGEFTACLILKRYFEDRGETERSVLLIPDSAHGTNPASAAISGFSTVEVKSKPNGRVNLDDLKTKLNDRTAGIMLTNPNTLGLFENEILELADMVHKAGGQLYYDGANANALVGNVRPGDTGFDVCHVNLHKTFSTPHGSGGPGSGPVGVKAHLAPYLPAPLVVRQGQGWATLVPEKSIGRVKLGYGNFGMLVRAWAYLLAAGGVGVRDISRLAILNANYLKTLLDDVFEPAVPGHCKHEFVVHVQGLAKDHGVKALDIAKRLLDYRVHPPTVYFPLTVRECLMMEPTETETLATLEDFAWVLNTVAREAQENPDFLHGAPYTTPVRRLDEVGAARNPVLTWPG